MHTHRSSVSRRQDAHVVGITLSAFHLQSLSEQHSQAIAHLSLPSPCETGALLCLSLCTAFFYFSCTVSSLAML